MWCLERHDWLHFEKQSFGSTNAGEALDQLQLGLVLAKSSRIAVVHHQTIAVALFRFAAGAVGSRQRIFDQCTLADFDQTDRAANMESFLAHTKRLTADTAHDALADHGGERHLGVGQNDDELVTPDAADAYRT